MYFQDRLVPRNGIKLRVLIGTRISGCANQKEVSLEDQADHGKAVVQDMYDGEVEYVIISTKGKGERLDRPELAEFESAFRTGTFDLGIFEDLGRLVRGSEASRLCGIAVDHGTRILAPDDGIDTNDPDWEQDVLEACKEHVGHNVRVSKRLKNKLMTRFRRNGAARADLPFGYILPEGGKTYFDAKKDPNPEVDRILKEGKELLRKSKNYSVVARYFNDQGAEGGTSRRQGEWTGASVKVLFENPILKGMPQRGKRMSDKHHESGRRISILNPRGPTFIDCPHLAYFAAEDIDPILAMLKEKNAGFSRARARDEDPRYRVPRKQTRFPGQFGTCWYCGSHFVWGGNGLKNHLMCARSRESKCWNSVGFSGALFVDRLKSAIFERLHALQGLDEQFRTLVADANKSRNVNSELLTLQREEEALKREQKNVMEAIIKYGPRDMFDQQIADTDRRAAFLRGTRYQLEASARRRLELPQSSQALSTLMEHAFQDLSTTSMDFGLLMREIVPEFHMYLVRLCDGGHPAPRIQARLDLSGICPDARLVDGLHSMLASTITVDVFEPPQRERIRFQAVKLAAEGHKQRDACQLIGEKPTQPAFQNALALQRKMDELDLKSPYVFLPEPPNDYLKLRRHKAKHFRFRPVEGYDRPELM
ncbi:MAG: recombinase family protein [Planctomycetota bacterium]